LRVVEDIHRRLHVSNDEDIESYITDIQGIKNALANVGETELSKTARRLEQAGWDRDFTVIDIETPPLLDALRYLIDKFKQTDAVVPDESGHKTIFLVDDDMFTLSLGTDVLSGQYDVFTMNSGARLMKTLEKHIPDLILLDVEMPEMNGYDLICKLKGDERFKDIPVIFLTAKSEVNDELMGLSLGALDYITKPFSPPLLLKRIELHLLIEYQRHELIYLNNNLQHLVEAKTKTVVELKNAVLSTFSELIDCRDDDTGGHIGRTQKYFKILIESALKHPQFHDEVVTWDIDLMLQSAQLHDVGKIAIHDSILKKPGRLTEDEFEHIKSHVLLGVEVIDKIMGQTTDQEFLRQAKILVSTHHEKWDGSGYPNGLKGPEIPLQGRMMAIVDVYDALTSDRPYKKALAHDEAAAIIRNSSGSHFDPGLVNIFCEVEETFKAICESGRAQVLHSAFNQ
jgi:putative two-component system response regulator